MEAVRAGVLRLAGLEERLGLLIYAQCQADTAAGADLVSDAVTHLEQAGDYYRRIAWIDAGGDADDEPVDRGDHHGADLMAESRLGASDDVRRVESYVTRITNLEVCPTESGAVRVCVCGIDSLVFWLQSN